MADGDPTQSPQQPDPALVSSILQGRLAQPAPTQGMPLVAGGPLSQGAPSPAGASGGLQDYAALAQQQIGQMQALPSVAEETGARQQATGLAQQAAQMPIPKAGPQIEHGQSFLHNLGQALLLAGSITRPGQALNEAIYGPGERAYQQKQSGLAEQIKALQGQATGAQEETGTMGAVAGRYLMGSSRVGAAQMSAQQMHERTQQLAQAATQRYSADIQRIQGEKDVAKMNNDARILGQKMRDATMIDIKQMGDVTAEDVTTMRDQTMASIANVVGAEHPSWMAAFMEGVMGVSTPQTPAGQAPVRAPVGGRGAAPATSAKPGAKGNTKPAYKGPDGKWYSDPQHKSLIPGQ